MDKLLDAAFSHRIASLAQPKSSVTAQSKFCIEFYYPVLDLLLSELQRRFSIESCEVPVQLPALNPAQWNEDNLENVGKLAKRYSIPEEPTCQEYTLFKSSRYYRGLLEEIEERRKRGWKKPYLRLILKKFGKGDLASLYPNQRSHNLRKFPQIFAVSMGVVLGIMRILCIPFKILLFG